MTQQDTAPTQRYTSPGRQGTHRPLTDTEAAAWRQVTSRWHQTPPFTEAANADNTAVATMLVDLFEDGVAVPTLAKAVNWGYPRVAGILHRSRGKDLGSGTRRYIAPAPKAPRPSFRRPLTSTEQATVREQYDALPRYAHGPRDWKSAAATTLIATLRALRDDRVALDTLADALGISRQAIHQRLAAHPAPQTATTATATATATAQDQVALSA